MVSNFREWLESDQQIPFDLYSQDSKRWVWLAEHIPGLIVSSAGGQLPFQASGLLHGAPFYYREEWGYANLKVGAVNGEEPFLLGPDTLYSATVDCPEQWRSFENFPFMMMKLVSELQVAPYCWEFSANKLSFADENNAETFYVTGEKDVKYSLGESAEQAFLKTRLPNSYLIEKGWSADLQERMWLAQEINPVPINKDIRVFNLALPLKVNFLS